MTIDPAAIDQYETAKGVLAELKKRHQDVVLTGREPDRTKKLDALDGAITLYTRASTDLAIQLADDLVAIYAVVDSPLPYTLTAAGLAASTPEATTTDRQIQS